MANSNKADGRPTSAPAVEPEVALLLTNEESLCEKAISLLFKVSRYPKQVTNLLYTVARLKLNS